MDDFLTKYMQKKGIHLKHDDDRITLTKKELFAMMHECIDAYYVDGYDNDMQVKKFFEDIEGEEEQ